jgi:hypothetical protein
MANSWSWHLLAVGRAYLQHNPFALVILQLGAGLPSSVVLAMAGIGYWRGSISVPYWCAALGLDHVIGEV